MAAVLALGDPTWINAVTYDSEELRRADGLLFVSGVTAGVPRSGVLSVRDMVLSLSGNNLMVGAGGAVIGTVKGAYRAAVSATSTVGALTAADATNPRRDRVIVEVLDPDNVGGPGRLGQVRIIDGEASPTAASGGGYPAAPATAFLDLGYVDVPKSGAGSPVVTVTAQITATAGSPVPVRSLAERDALPKWDGAQSMRLDVAGRPVETWDGAAWVSGPTWISYTPQLRATSTNPNIGTGQALGRYMVQGKMLFVQTFVSFGTGLSAGSGTYQVTLPAGFTYGGLGSAIPVGDFSAKVTTAAEVSGVVKLAAAGSNLMQMYWQSGTGNTTQSPITSVTGGWANASHVAIQAAVPIV